MIFLLAAVVGFSGIYFGAFFLSNVKTRVYLHAPMLASLGIYYGLGACVTIASLSSADFEAALSEAQLQREDLVIPLLIIGLCLFAVHCVAVRWPNIFSIRTSYVADKLKALESRTLLVKLATLLIGAQIYLYLTGALGFQGILKEVGEDFKVSPLAVFVQPWTGFSLLLSGWLLSRRRFLFLTVLIIVTQLAVLLLTGRRALAVGIALLLTGILLGGGTKKRVLLIGGILAGFFVFAFQLFFAARGADTSDVTGQVASEIKVRVTEGFGAVTTTDVQSKQQVRDELRRNVANRTFIIGYFAMLVASPRSDAGALGELTYGNLLTIVPRIIWPGKDSFLAKWGGEEEVAYRSFQLPRLTDEATTVFTAGYTEYREAGVLIYWVLIMAGIYGCVELITKLTSPLLVVYSISYLITLGLEAEGTMSTWFLFGRDLALIYGLHWLFWRWWRMGSQTVPRHHAF